MVIQMVKPKKRVAYYSLEISRVCEATTMSEYNTHHTSEAAVIYILVRMLFRPYRLSCQLQSVQKQSTFFFLRLKKDKLKPERFSSVLLQCMLHGGNLNKKVG